MNRDMSATAAKAIRNDLKTILGAGQKRVSVKSTNYGTVTVTVLDATLSLAAVSEIANKYAVTHRCEATGELLIGGTSVRVDFSDAALAPMVAEVLEQIDAGDHCVTYRGIKAYPCEGDVHAEWSITTLAQDFRAKYLRTWGRAFTAKQIAKAVLAGHGACSVHSDCAEHVELGVACAESRAAA